MKSARRILLLFLFMGVATVQGWSQEAPAQALDNVIIHHADGSTTDDGTIVWRNGIIEAAGDDVTIPFDAYVIDGGDSLHVYPGFLDGLALWGSPDLPDSYEQPERPGEPGYERAGIQPERQPSKLLNTEDSNLETAQKQGFTTAALGLKGQMLPGQIDLFFVNGSSTDEHLYKESLALHGQFEEAPGGWGSGAYPATLMGIMAELRQLWYDATALQEHANYYASNSDSYPAPKKDGWFLKLCFRSWAGSNRFIFAGGREKENIERLFWLKDELGFNVVVVSGKEAHEKAEELEQRDIPVLASIDLPEEPEWNVKEEETEESEKKASEMEEVTEEMRIFREKQLAAYQTSIENISKLIEAGVKVGYASNGMELSELSKNVKTLIEGTDLTEQQILGMLTQHTADILGVGSRLGDLRQGRIASFSVFNKPFTEEKAAVKCSVSNGQITEFDEE
ncbi:MAG: amidohydrolase family protein [Balneolaceae bacterium]|nr:amidohydrolase family protein [Balneolaceae bacterium]